MKKNKITFEIPFLLMALICLNFLIHFLKIDNNIFQSLKILSVVFTFFWFVFIVFKWLNENKFFRVNIKKIIKCIDNSSFKLLILFSLVWVIIAFSMLLQNNIIKDTLKILLINSQHLKPNEWGDFFAGFIAPLAFIWIGFGVYYQKKEFANIVKSFNLQKEEFKKSVDVMKEQVVQIEVQQHNAWFNRNYQSIVNVKNKIFDDLKTQKIDSFFTIYKTLHVDFENSEKELFNIFDEIKIIIDMHRHIDLFIEKELYKNNVKEEISSILKTLKQEFNLLKGDDIKYCTKILKKVYIVIVAGKEHKKYEKYFEAYGHWIEDYSHIHNFIQNRKTSENNDKIIQAIKDIDNVKLDFIKGTING